MSDAAASCSDCGTLSPATPGDHGDQMPEDPPLTWSREVDRGRVSWLCEACSRAHVRAIEGRLDPRWW